MTATDRTAELCDFLTKTRADDLPPALFDIAKGLLVDHFGVALHSVALPWSDMIRRQAFIGGGGATATIYGLGRAGMRDAALANGTTAHGIELDDTHDESLSHPGAVVIPSALAVAETRGAGGRDLLTAMILGYEAQGRVGATAGKALIHEGFHPTSANGVFGAAAAAGHLFGLDSDGLQRAFGIALSMASGSMQFSMDDAGTMVKRLHAGMPSERGLLAAALASDGFTGPRQAIEAQYGFLRLFAGHDRIDRLVRDLGDGFEIQRISIKLYACCRLFHAAIDALEACRDALGSPPADAIRRIEVLGPRLLFEQHMEYRPRSVMAAQYSLPFTMAAAVLLDAKDPRSFDQAAMTRPDLLALGDRVSGREDAGLEAHFPARFPAGIRLELADGRVEERNVLDSRGTPGWALDRAGIETKFRALTDGVVAPADQRRLIEAVDGLDETGGLDRLTRLLGSRELLLSREPQRRAAV